MHLHGKKTVRWAASTYTAACVRDGWHFQMEGYRFVLARRTDETLRAPENIYCGNARTNTTGGGIRSSLFFASFEMSRETVRALKPQHPRSSFDTSRGKVRKPRLQHPRANIQNPLWRGDSANAQSAPRSSCKQNPLMSISSSSSSRDRVCTPKLHHPRADDLINPLWQGNGAHSHLASWSYSSLNWRNSQYPLQNPIQPLGETGVDINMEDAPVIVPAIEPGIEPEKNNTEPVEVRPRLNIIFPTPSGVEKTEINSLIDLMSSLAI